MKIILDKSKCIGCGSCAALCSKFFELGEDGKSHLKGSKLTENEQKEELEISEPGCAKEAAEVCPVQAIHID
jgi:ferredoxin